MKVAWKKIAIVLAHDVEEDQLLSQIESLP